MITDEMREAIFNAKLGDDVFCEGPTVNQLEALADKYGKDLSFSDSNGFLFGHSIEIVGSFHIIPAS